MRNSLLKKYFINKSPNRSNETQIQTDHFYLATINPSHANYDNINVTFILDQNIRLILEKCPF